MQDILHCLKKHISEHRQEDCYKMKKIHGSNFRMKKPQPAIVQDSMKWEVDFLFGMKLTDF